MKEEREERNGGGRQKVIVEGLYTTIQNKEKQNKTIPLSFKASQKEVVNLQDRVFTVNSKDECLSNRP